ncbi:unnamed protein product [Zymoseptoria tritici ST99CH_1A5]|uniref:Uncharacterized protein n=1 Tax=Zymoseptoria tritici ST99CH_1A5 TaxID=1276529 RepID=A0A1Y6M1K4_ZYMTR|nr:unnamed protein product [Zymoseptoria tritici ST99CH_1A5]
MIQERPVTQIVNLHSIVVRIQPTTRNGEHEKEHEKDHDKEHRKEACWTRSMHLDGFRGVHARCGCLCLMILANQTPTSNAPWLAIEDADRRCEEDHITTQFQLEDNCGDNADTPVPNHDQSTSIEAQHIGSIVNKLEDNRGNNTDTAIHEQCFFPERSHASLHAECGARIALATLNLHLIEEGLRHSGLVLVDSNNDWIADSTRGVGFNLLV